MFSGLKNSGKEVLATINSGLNLVKEQVVNSEQELEHLNNQRAELEKSETSQFKKLAKLRLNLLATGDIIKRLDASEQRAQKLLQQRRQTLLALKQQIENLEKERAVLETQRDHQADSVDKANEALDQREAETQQTLAADANYQQHLQQAKETDRIATHAEEKTDVATRDKIEKGKPYEQDVLFMYLWKRKYGLSEYRSKGLIRFLDQKVAYLTGYDKARANYNMLTELPVRLQGHAGKKRKQADEAFESLKQLELDAAATNGVPELQNHLDTEEQALQEAEQILDDHDAKVLALKHQEAAFVAGDDNEFQNILKLLSTTFRQDDLTELYQDATETPLPEDDLIVMELMKIKRDQQDLGDTLSQQRNLLMEQQQRELGLTSVQRSFKQSRYDALNSVFTDSEKVSLLIKQYLNGVLDSNILWQQLQKLQKTQATYSNPLFGSAGIPRRGGVVWGGGRLPFPRGGSGGFSFPRRGGFGGLGSGGLGGLGGLGRGGGFKTGGGF